MISIRALSTIALAFSAFTISASTSNGYTLADCETLPAAQQNMCRTLVQNIENEDARSTTSARGTGQWRAMLRAMFDSHQAASQALLIPQLSNPVPQPAPAAAAAACIPQSQPNEQGPAQGGLAGAIHRRNHVRCVYAGFAIPNGGASTNQCRPIRNTSEMETLLRRDDKSLRLAHSFPNMRPTDCPSRQVMCNPLLYGLRVTGHAHCVSATASASADCQRVSRLLEPEVRSVHQQSLQAPGVGGALTLLAMRVEGFCNPQSQVHAGGAGSPRATKASQSDFTETCKHAREQLDDVLRDAQGCRVNLSSFGSRPPLGRR